MTSDATILTPIPYHAELKNFLKKHEAEMWNWFASAEAKASYAEELRLDLLKSTYRLGVESHAGVYAQAEIARQALGLDIPITIYQSQQSIGWNASLYYLPGEGHIVLSGNILQLLKEDEVLSVLAHELAHYQLWQRESGEYHVMDRLVRTLAQSPRSTPSHHYTAKNAQLYTEIYCDRGSWMATRDIAPMVRGLVKIQTGTSEIDAASYLKQAEEVFQQKPGASEGTSHPETYIRAHALSLWVRDGAAAEAPIAQMIEGSEGIDELDLIGQHHLCGTTRSLISDLLQPEWFRTSSVMAHARLFFDDFPDTPPATIQLDGLKFHAKIQEYLGYVLLDFSVMDPELEDEPLKQAIRVARNWGFESSFAKLAQKELKIKVRDWEKLGAEK